MARRRYDHPRQTHGAKSLDDYAKVFAGGVSSPKVVTYTRADIEGYLNQVTPYDWHGFFEKYVYTIAPVPPTDEIARAGYRLVYTDQAEQVPRGRSPTVADSIRGSTSACRSAKGDDPDVRQDSPAWKAGLAPGMQ